MKADIALVEYLSQTIDATLSRLGVAGQPCAIVDFPDHANPGDSAIWLGEVAALRRLRSRIVYTEERSRFCMERLRSRLGEQGVILLHGGGNLGDLWPRHQRFREKIVAAFPSNRIVQLPQSIHFDDHRALRQAAEIFNRHRDLTLLVRDSQSERLARTHFRAHVELCPDMAFALGSLESVRIPKRDVVYVARKDHESRQGNLVDCTRGGSVLVTDWDDPDVLARVNSRPARGLALARRVFGKARSSSIVADRMLLSASVGLFNGTAKSRVRGAVALLSSGRVIVSDRLHAHILCLLMGQPHVAVDNRYGKVHSFIETWTSSAHAMRLGIEGEDLADPVDELLAAH